MEGQTPVDQQEFCGLLADMTQSIVSARESVKKLATEQDLDTKNGISLLSLKHHLLLSYLQSLVLVSAHRVLGHKLDDRTPPAEPFSSAERKTRGSNAGDLVDSMVENRIVLEKIKVLESKMRYQIEKLVRLAEETPAAEGDVVDDPLAFRPNPQNLMNQESEASGAESANERDARNDERDGIYRPPKLAPVPYTEPQRGKKARRPPPIPTALSSLTHLDPHVESTSGLGVMPSLQSGRARELQRMTEFEEENFTRLVMKKKEANRRRRDEEDIALGGTGGASGGKGRRRGGAGLQDEFDDVLRAVARKRDGVVGDGYEELRQKARKGDALTRSRMRSREEIEGDDGPREKKRGRFEKARQTMKKKASGRMRR